MKRIVLRTFLASLTMSSLAYALSPAYVDLDERVGRASHIFVGEVLTAELKNQSAMWPGDVTYTIKVKNVIFPNSWYSHEPLRASGLNGLEYAGAEMIGTSHVFIVKMGRDSKGELFVAAAGSQIKEPTERKNDIIRSLYKRLWKSVAPDSHPGVKRNENEA